jgi:hypothetical protein
MFVPIAIKTLGMWGASAADFCREFGTRLASLTGDPRSLLFLKQRLGLAVQRGNCVTLPQLRYIVLKCMAMYDYFFVIS